MNRTFGEGVAKFEMFLTSPISDTCCFSHVRHGVVEPASYYCHIAKQCRITVQYLYDSMTKRVIAILLMGLNGRNGTLIAILFAS